MKNSAKPLSKDLSGTAGEYFVAAELSRRGYIASLTLNNAKGVDIIATNSQATKSVAIQVKTNQGDAREWLLNMSAEKSEAPNFFYVFVALGGDRGQPRYHIVLSKEVAKSVADYHIKWMSGRKRDGSLRKSTAMRTFFDKDDKYLDCWSDLGLE